MSQITDPSILENSSELPVRDFNKKEVEQIAKSVCEPRFDVDNPFYGVETVNANSTDEFFAAINDGKLPLSSKSDLTDEQMKKILTIMKKAINGKVVNRYKSEFFFINYCEISSDTLTCCFGCVSNHISIGLHVEYRLNLSENSFTCNMSEI